MAETDKDQKTEEPTDKRLEDSRRKGEVASAPEMRHAAIFAAALLVTGGMGTHAITSMGPLLTGLWGGADQFALTPAAGQDFAIGIFGRLAAALGPLLATLFVFAILGGLMQGRLVIAWSRIAPKWSKLNPFAGFKRLFGGRALVEFAKTVAKLCAIVGVAFWVVWPRATGIDQLVGADPWSIGAAASGMVSDMLRSIAVLVGALALFDFVYQRRAFLKRMRMSLQEVKDEHKESEGDPKIKGKIRQIQYQRAKRRMMAAVPGASVVITNPTHYAVALKYDHGAMAAPVVVAKGVDAVALRIREIATEAGVPLVENRPLARALHASAEVDQPIPIEHYAAVAEVISYVMRLAKRRG
jgi:flagellar biosynthetic protein FlhB